MFLLKRLKLFFIVAWGLLIICISKSFAEVSETLFFMGEDIQVVTIASGRPELPENAPAIVDIKTSQDLDNRGILSLAEILSQSPGFYLEPIEKGHRLYMRGTPSGALFLYDSIPLTTDSTKSIYPLNYELSLTSVKRIEVVRGPASVLWGPDAFAGVINVVPKTGEDLNGAEIGIIHGLLDDYEKLFLNFGKNDGLWNSFISFNGCWDKQNNDYMQKYYEVVYNFDWDKSFKLSGRYSYYNNPYSSYSINTDNVWQVEENSSILLLKLEGKRKINDFTSFAVKSFINKIKQKRKEKVFLWNKKNTVYYLEGVIDREFFNKHGLLTCGLAYRINKVDDADIRTRSFFPEYIDDIDTNFYPLIEHATFSTKLGSVFFQYRHHLKNWDMWLGTRIDKHNQYKRTISYNIGILRRYGSFYVKGIYGTAYRTPYAAQFIGKSNLNPEVIESFGLEFNYHLNNKFSCSFTPFYNTIHNHINEDYYGGYSQPNKQHILGFESTLEYKILSNLEIFFNASFLNSWGDNERYTVLDYITLIPNQKPQEHYYTWSKKYNDGASKIFNFLIQYKVNRYIDAFLSTRYISAVKHNYKDKEYIFDPYIVSDLNINIHDILPNLKASISIKNIFNHKYKTPGRFGPIQGKPLTIFIKFTYLFN